MGMERKEVVAKGFEVKTENGGIGVGVRVVLPLPTGATKVVDSTVAEIATQAIDKAASKE